VRVLDDRVDIGGGVWTAVAQRPVGASKARPGNADHTSERDLEVGEKSGDESEAPKKSDGHDPVASLLSGQVGQLRGQHALIDLADLAAVDRAVGPDEHGHGQRRHAIGTADLHVRIKERRFVDAEFS